MLRSSAWRPARCLRRTAPFQGGVMATNTIARGKASRKSLIPVRRIDDEDLRFALRQGLSDFRAFRGDIVFAGLVYTFIGVAAVVMTTSMPLMPYFVPVVAGVGLLGPV